MPKPVSKKARAAGEFEPVAERPLIPAEYGIPRDKKGLLPWSHVVGRMNSARCYWIATVSPDGQPYATPVDGLWLDGRLHFGGSPNTKRNRNLAANPSVCVHLESGTDVVILHGEARELRSPGTTLAVRLSEASKEKYGYGWKTEDYEKTPGLFEFRPRAVLAWKHFPEDATRWRLPGKE